MPKRVDAKNRQNQILAAATSVFVQKGFANARMDDIAATAGVSKGTLYLYFASKEAIIHTLLAQVFQIQEDEIQALLAMPERPISERVLLIAQTVAQQVTTLTDFLRIAYQFIAMTGQSEEVQQHLHEYFVRYRIYLAELFQQGIAHGELADLGSSQMALALLALMEGMCLLWLTTPTEVPIETSLVEATKILLAGMKRSV